MYGLQFKTPKFFLSCFHHKTGIIGITLFWVEVLISCFFYEILLPSVYVKPLQFKIKTMTKFFNPSKTCIGLILDQVKKL